MPVRVVIPQQLRQHTDSQTEVQVNGATVKAVIDDLCARHPALAARILDNNQIRRFLNIYLNSEDIRFLDNLATPVKDGDEVELMPAVTGG